MHDDDLDDLPEDFPVEEGEDILDQIDSSFVEMGLLEEHPLTGTVLSRQEMDDLVDHSITEELSRLDGV